MAAAVAELTALYAGDKMGRVLTILPTAGSPGTFEVHCMPGFYAAPLTGLTSANAASYASTVRTMCSQCALPTNAPSNVAVTSVGGSDPSGFLLTCLAGFVASNAPGTIASGRAYCNPDSATFSVTQYPQCVAVPVGFYALAGGPAVPCPAGTYGASTGLTTPACSGQCMPGYICPAGSTVSNPFPCGVSVNYCPAGSSAPLICPSGSYTGPLAVGAYPAAPETNRYTCTACPVNRLCSAGRLLPAVDFSASCPGGSLTVAVTTLTSGSGNTTNATALTNSDFGPLLAATTYGLWSSISYSVNVSIPDAGCPVTPAGITYNSATSSLRIGATGLNAGQCPLGAVVTVIATRNGDPYDQPPTPAVCSVQLYVSQNALPPAVLQCNATMTLPEFTTAQAVVPVPFRFQNQNLLTTLLYNLQSVVPSPNVTSPNPFALGSCSGLLTTTAMIRYAVAQSYTLTVRADNYGILPVLSSYCTFVINVQQVNVPPTLGVTFFSTYDLQPVGSLVGNVQASSLNGRQVSGYRVVNNSLDAAGFYFDAAGQGNLLVGSASLNSFVQSLFKITVNFTDGIFWTTANVTIVLLDSPRPPTCFPATLTVNQSAAVGSSLSGGPLKASHPQLLPFTFSVTDPLGNFASTPAGVVTIATSLASINLPADNAYSLTFAATDSNGRASTCPLTVNVVPINRKCQFNGYLPTGAIIPSFSATVSDGAAASSTIARMNALDPDVGQVLIYSLSGCSPLQPPLNACPFQVNPVTGDVSLTALPAGGLRYNDSVAFATPQTFSFSLAAVDSGSPPLTCTAVATVQVVNIAPFLAFPTNLAVPGNVSTVGILPVLLNDKPFVTLAAGYQRSNLVYTASGGQTAEGVTVFAVNATGAVRVVSNAWNFATRSVFTLSVTVTDSSSGASAAAPLNIRLLHYNTPPVFVNSTIALSAIEGLNAAFGSPLSTAIVDPDLALNVGERLNFTILSQPNDNIFAINAATGQLSVVNAASTAFVYSAAGTILTLIVTCTDAGIDGPRAYTAQATVNVLVAPSSIPPSVPSYSFSVAEHTGVGASVGSPMKAVTSVPCAAPATCPTFAYSLSPALGNLNQPFPFAVTTVAGVPSWALASAQIVVVGGQGPINYSPFNGQGNFRLYNATLTVIETRPGIGQLTAQGAVSISVTYVAEPPFFSPLVTTPPASAGQLNSYVFTAYVSERSAPGTNLSFVSSPLLAATPGFVLTPAVSSPAQATATSKDPGARLAYSLAVASTVFSINANTGQLSLAATAPAIVFNTQSSYSLTIKAMDQASGLFDTATVTVKVVQINNAAVFNGLFAAATGGAQLPAVVQLNETAPVGALVGFARFTDADQYPVWAGKNFALSGAGVAGAFAIDANTGAITVAGPLAWLDRANFTLAVACTDDDPFSPITALANVTVALVQQNRVSIAGFAAAPAAVGGSFAAPTGAYAAFAALSDVLFATTGSSVLISGAGFGYTGARLAAAGAQLVPTVTYGPVTGAEFVAAGCAVSTAGSAITCPVPAGVGRDLLWRVSIGGFLSPVSARRTSYFPPAVTAVTAAAGLPTAGGAAITVTGTSFGTALTFARLYYGQPGAETSLAGYNVLCTVTTAQVLLSCPAAPGVGAGLSFMVVVGASSSSAVFGQAGASNSSTFAPAPAVGYNAPTVSSVGAPSVVDTAGGAAFNISGANFGPVGSPISVTYGKDLAGLSQPVFTATGCVVATAHTMLRCLTAPGVGAGFLVKVQVANQATTPTATTLAYSPPQVTGLSGSGLASMPTPGGTIVILTGRNFGPVGLTLPDLVTPVNPGASYGPGANPFRFAAAGCSVSVKNTQITCSSAPGTGAGHAWSVNVGGQTSAAFNGSVTSYSPPVVASYAGAGVLADTTGGEIVNVTGMNFGPTAASITSVTYGRTGTEFTAQGCSMPTPHTQISCRTAVGAGAGLTWLVTVDGQRSIVPTTAYLAPVINYFLGKSVDASTDGGDVVVLRGQYFSTQAFLGAVTYGPGGNEFKANCSVTVAHVEITCRMAPGTGRALTWVVTVGNQTSARSAQTTSYAAPSIASVAPSTDLATGGGTVVRVVGANFGLLAPASVLQVLVNARGLARPACQGDYFSLLLRGLPDDGACAGAAAYQAGLAVAPSFSKAVLVRGASSQLSFSLPAGFGQAAEMMLLVDGVPSANFTLAYGTPFIRNVAPNRVNVSQGFLRLIVEGVNFCNGAGGCGSVVVDGSTLIPVAYSDTQVTVIVPDPQTLPTGPSSSVQISVGNGVTGVATSNAVAFSAPVPSITNIAAQPNWAGAASVVVDSAALTFSVALLSTASGLSASAVATPAVGGPLRAAVKIAAGLGDVSDVNIVTLVNAADGVATTFANGDAVNTVRSARLLAGGSGPSGCNITFAVDLVQTASDRRLLLTADNINALAANVTAALQRPAFVQSIVARAAAAAGVSASAVSAALVAASFATAQTSHSVAAAAAQPTAGGAPFYITGVADLFYVDASQLTISFGPFACTNTTKVQDGNIGPENGVQPFLADGTTPNPLAVNYFTYRVTCTTPPGVGAGLAIRISTPSGTSAADPNFVFSYSPPTIADVVDAAAGATASYLAGAASFPTTGTAAAAARLVGANFGSVALMQTLCVYQLGAAACAGGLPTSIFSLSVAMPFVPQPADVTALPVSCPNWAMLRDAAFASPPPSTACSCPNCGVVSTTYSASSIVFAMPPGQGARVQLQLTIGGQTAVTGTGSAATVRYLSPTISTAFNPGTGVQGDSTTGGTPLQITGSNFGTGIIGTSNDASSTII